MRGAVLRGEFNPRGKLSTFALGETTLSDLVDTFVGDYVQKRREDGRLRSTALDYYLKRLRAEFGSEKLGLLEQSPKRFETWLDSLDFTTGREGRRVTRKLSPASWNRYYEVGRRIFNWAVAQGYAKANPFLKFSKRPERNKRETRISVGQEKRSSRHYQSCGASGSERR